VLTAARRLMPPAQVLSLDATCSGKPNALLIVPDDPTQPVLLMADRKGTGKADAVFVFKGHSNNIAFALFDSQGSGKPDLVGYFKDGQTAPYKVEPYHGQQVTG
jgi:hypothetical protein